MVRSSRKEIGKKELLRSQILDKNIRENSNKKIMDIQEEIEKLQHEDSKENINKIEELKKNLKALYELRDGKD